MLPYLRTRELVLPRHQQHLVRWVRDFLLFAEEQGGYIFEQTLDLFLTAVGERVGIKSWQIQQAVDAVRISCLFGLFGVRPTLDT